MNILAIETSSLVASAAVMSDDIMIAEYTMNYKKTHSQTLLPMIDEICRMTEFDINNIDAIAVSAGPGSFTGLRIGSATAKGLGLALDIPLIHVPTVEAMAYNIYDTDKLICPVMDARRGQVYTGVYRNHTGNVEVIKEQCAISIDELLELLEGYGCDVIFLGDGVPVLRDTIDEKLKNKHYYAPSHMNRQRAGAVAEAGKHYYELGRLESAAEHRPDYLRLSQAERELAEKNRSKNGTNTGGEGGESI